MRKKYSYIDETFFAKIKTIGSIDYSPDGNKVVFSVMSTNLKENSYSSDIYLIPNLKNKRVKRLTYNKSNDYFPKWSYDGKWIAFVSNREKVQSIWVMSSDGGEPVRVLNNQGVISGYSWSYDNKNLIISFREMPSNANKNLKHTMKRFTIFPTKDTGGFVSPYEFQLYKLNLKKKKITPLCKVKDMDQVMPQVTSDNKYVYFFGFDRNKTNNGLREIFDMNIYKVGLGGGKPKLVKTFSGPKGVFRISPDGKKIAVIGHMGCKEDYWEYNNHLWIINTSGGKPINITKKIDNSLGNTVITDVASSYLDYPLYWSDDSSKLYFFVSERGACNIKSASLKGDIENITTAKQVVLSFSFSKGNIVYTASRQGNPSELFFVDKGKNEKVLTKFNKNLFSNIKMAYPEEFEYKGAKGDRIHGWFLKSLKPGNPKKKAPLLVQIHGGPHMQYGFAFFHEMYFLASAGFNVVFANIHGSMGYGKNFVKSIEPAWGKLEYEDVDKLLNYFIRKGIAEPGKIGILGGSYGGFMTAWQIGHSNRFKAAVAQRGVYNLSSFVTTSDGGLFFRYAQKAIPWKDRKKYYERSPIAYAEKIKTPLLIIHSTSDLRTPFEQGEQLYGVMKMLGKEVELVVFEGEGHELSRSGRPLNRIERLKAMRDWFIKYLKT